MLRNYSFVIEDVLAGCGLPGIYGDLQEDLEQARHDGVVALVSLTEASLDKAMVEQSGIKYLHLPIWDYTAPEIRQIKQFVDFVDQARKKNGAALVHCFAGIGRTGTMLAAYLVKEGFSAMEAIDFVREKRPGSLEVDDQVNIVFEYEQLLEKEEKSSRKTGH